MKRNTKIIIIMLVIAVVVVTFLPHKKAATSIATTPTTSENSVIGCYAEHLANDVYTLNITSENDDTVSGTLAFKNFEKDSSTGTFTGSFTDNVLLGDYTFNSEGMSSIRQVIFKKGDNGFVEGFGPVTSVGNRESFTDIKKVTFDSSSTFEPSTECVSSK